MRNLVLIDSLQFSGACHGDLVIVPRDVEGETGLMGMVFGIHVRPVRNLKTQDGHMICGL